MKAKNEERSMIANTPMPAPQCPTGIHGATVFRPARAEIDAWCGTWYDCPECGASVLFKSPELRKNEVSNVKLRRADRRRSRTES